MHHKAANGTVNSTLVVALKVLVRSPKKSGVGNLQVDQLRRTATPLLLQTCEHGVHAIEMMHAASSDVVIGRWFRFPHLNAARGKYSRQKFVLPIDWTGVRKNPLRCDSVPRDEVLVSFADSRAHCASSLDSCKNWTTLF